MTNHYELFALIAASYAEEELGHIKEQVHALISKYGGSVSFEENLGKKKLAYPVEKNHQGYYLLFEFDLDGDKLAELEKNLRLSNEIMRHIIVKRTPLSVSRRLSLGREKSRLKPEKARLPASEEHKVNIKDLDQKLDEILEGDIL